MANWTRHEEHPGFPQWIRKDDARVWYFYSTTTLRGVWRCELPDSTMLTKANGHARSFRTSDGAMRIMDAEHPLEES